MKKIHAAIFLLPIFIVFGCEDDKMDMMPGSLTSIEYNPSPYELELPDYFPEIDENGNPMTVEGVTLGRHLFYDPILSGDSTMSCASCHEISKSFADNKAVSTGIDGIEGRRSAMSLVNVAYIKNGLLWDGRSPTLEDQAAIPVLDELELHDTWDNVEEKLQIHPEYPVMFRKAFGITNKSEITQDLATKAIAQFERIIVSFNSKFDRVVYGNEGELFTDLELLGESMYFDNDPDVPDAECSHCHNTPLMTSDDYFNNGLDESDDQLNFKDLGRGGVTGNFSDRGKFKAPTLRNIMLTPPYMHDGRFATIDEVLDHYNSGGKPSLNKDPLLHDLGLNDFYLRALKAYLGTFTDTTFYNNPDLQNPFE